MPNREEIRSDLYNLISLIVDNESICVNDELQLIGGLRVLDSMKLVELCLALEDRAAEIGFEFDWTSDAAMSRSRSMFRTVGSLTSEFILQMEAKQ